MPPINISEESITGGTIDGEPFDKITADGDLEYIAPPENVAYGGEDGNTYVHNFSDGALRYTLTENGGEVNDVGVSASYVAYGGFGQKVYVHDLSDGILMHTLTKAENDYGDPIDTIALSDSYIGYGGTNGGGLYMHDSSDGSLLYNKSGDPEDIAFSESYVAHLVGGPDNTVYVRDISDGSLVYTLSENNTTLLCCDITDTYVAYGGRDNNEYSLYVHDLSDGSLAYTFTSGSEDTLSVGLSEKYVAYGQGFQGLNDGTYGGPIYVYNLSNWSLEYYIKGVSDVNDIEMSYRYLISGNRSDYAAVYDLSDGSRIYKFEESQDEYGDLKNGVGID